MLCGVTVRENDRQAEGCVCVPLFSACAHTHSPTIALLHKFTLRVCRAVIMSVCVYLGETEREINVCTNERTETVFVAFDSQQRDFYSSVQCRRQRIALLMQSTN